jgi:hypothetical protein
VPLVTDSIVQAGDKAIIMGPGPPMITTSCVESFGGLVPDTACHDAGAVDAA